MTTEELRKLAREKFGRELTDAEAQLFAARLPSMAQAADVLLVWQSKLGETAPAINFSLPPRGPQ